MSPSASDVYTADDLRDWPAATAGCRPPWRLAVFGDPVAHSVSPPMQNAALAAAGIDARYTRVHVRPAELAPALRRLVAAGFVGVNLTIPHKAAALPLLDAVDPYAAGVGAVNTVRVEADGSLRGFNTDGPGLVRAVRDAFDLDFHDARVMILGAAGGTGRTLAAQCVLLGCRRVALVNRTPEKARQLAAELAAHHPGHPGGLEVVPWEKLADGTTFGEIDLVVNASSVGLRGEPSPIPPEAIPARLRVFDAVYRSTGEATALLAAARQAGARTADGLALLLHQGAYSFQHWFGRPASLAAMRHGLDAALGRNPR